MGYYYVYSHDIYIPSVYSWQIAMLVALASVAAAQYGHGHGYGPAPGHGYGHGYDGHYDYVSK